jgi:hypothetical protein
MTRMVLSGLLHSMIRRPVPAQLSNGHGRERHVVVALQKRREVAHAALGAE